MKRLILTTLLAALLTAVAPARSVPPGNMVQGRGYGTGVGVRNRPSGPEDGTGYGAKGQRKGKSKRSCDNTGPKGQPRGGQGRSR